MHVFIAIERILMRTASTIRVSFAVVAVVLHAVICCSGCATLRRTPVADHVVTARQLSLRGLDAVQHGDVAPAESLFAAAIEANPADERAHRHYAELLWGRGIQEQAVRHMEESVRLSGGDPELLVELGEMYRARGDHPEAEQQAEMAIAAQRQTPAAWALRGDLLRDQSRLPEAMESYHRALSLQPHYPRVQIALAELYQKQNRPRRALATLESLSAQYGTDQTPSEVLFLEGLALKALGRYDNAVAVLSTAVSRGEPSAELLYQLGDAHQLAGDTASAAITVQAALARDAGHVPSQLLNDLLQHRPRDMTAGIPPARTRL